MFVCGFYVVESAPASIPREASVQIDTLPLEFKALFISMVGMEFI
jgi:hypothetical protein